MRKIVISALVAAAVLVIAGGSAVPAAAASSVSTASTASAGPGPDAVVSASLFILGSTISCGSPTTCLSVGLDFDHPSGTPTPIAEAWNGGGWRSVAVPTPKGSVLTLVTGVSCRSADSCLVIGDYDTAGENGSELPYAMTWNGVSLRRTATVPVPKNSSLVSFNALSCVSVSRCVAVGSLATGALPLAVETWNGATWTLRTARSAAGAAFSDVNAVSCLSVTSCVIAGETYSDSGTVSMLLARWNGKGLTAMKAARPAGAPTLELDGVSCVSASSCVATGLGTNDAGTKGFGFTEVWNGRSWAVHKVAAPKGDTLSFLFGVSCATARNCVAVGAAGTSDSGAASAVAYNGKAWTSLAVPAPGKGKSSYFSGVSCPKADDCVAIGDIGPSAKAAPTPLAGRWNGSSWRLAAA